jgi:hypothetical protein
MRIVSPIVHSVDKTGGFISQKLPSKGREFQFVDAVN